MSAYTSVCRSDECYNRSICLVRASGVPRFVEVIVGRSAVCAVLTVLHEVLVGIGHASEIGDANWCMSLFLWMRVLAWHAQSNAQACFACGNLGQSIFECEVPFSRCLSLLCHVVSSQLHLGCSLSIADDVNNLWLRSTASSKPLMECSLSLPSGDA